METAQKYYKEEQLDSESDLVNEILRLKAESKKLEEEIKLRTLALNLASNSSVITDDVGNIVWVNEGFTKLTGYTSEEVINKNPRILKSGKHSKRFYTDLWKTIISGKEWKGEITNKKKDGTFYHEKIRITPVFNTNKKITNFIATKADITEQKKTDDALNESYIKYEELAYIVNQSPAVGFLWSVNKEKTVEFVTDNVKQWGYTPEEFYSQNLAFSDIIYKADKQKVLEELSIKIDSGNERLKQHYRIITKSGEVRWIDSHLYARLGENDSVTHLQGVVLDVTERKLVEEESKNQLEQLMQADKMIALGTLVSGVAHEINNPNNFVMLNIPLIEKVWFSILPILQNHADNNGDFYVGERLLFSKIKDSMPLLLGGINEGSKRIKNIVEDLKSFARKDSSNYNQNVDINKVIQTSVNLTANLISKSTDRFYVTYSKDPIIIAGNKQKLEQVIINMIENSCQALTDRKQSVRIEIQKNCTSVFIKISDEGKGMKPAIIKNITDPFFTTKRNNGGTGLGLSITSKIIMQHEGELDFESKPNEGTKAIIKLPIQNGK